MGFIGYFWTIIIFVMWDTAMDKNRQNKPRNPDILKKGGPHEKSRKAERKRDKDKLRKQDE